MGKMTATMVKALKDAGRYGDGDGLFLLVSSTGARSWVCRVQKNGKRRDFGLGSEKKVSLSLARERARTVRCQIESGIDPIAERRKAAGIPTFREAAAKVFAENHKSWKNAKHKAQWLTSLEAYAFPIIGEISVSAVDAAAVRDVLVAIWLTKPETARRVRQRINAVMDWAVANGYCETPLLMAVVNKSLPKARAKAKHHAALPYSDVPAFIETLRSRESVGRLAFELLILTATRSGEVRGARLTEFDMEAATWTIPAERMKADREHVIPLCQSALLVLAKTANYREISNELVFPGTKMGKPLSDMTLTKICRDAEINAVPHGFRSSFRDWVSEETDFDGTVAEMALAHTIENKVEAAYRRGNLFEKRRALMMAWGTYCTGPMPKKRPAA
jgi:integrase